MARAATTVDAFSAVAEPRRREVLGCLVAGERPVNDLVQSLGWTQPQVSKHLNVLLRVGLVNVRKVGRQRVYSVNGMQVKPIFDWAGSFEKFWDDQLARIKQRAEEKEKQSAAPVGREPKE